MRTADVCIGDVIGRLTVIRFAERNEYGIRQAVVRCECGTEKTVTLSNLGKTSSCGCVKRERLRERNAGPNRPPHAIKHGGAGTLEYFIFKSAKRRCQSPRDKKYGDYGGRGIEFRFRDFQEFMAAVGPRPSRKHSLDRVNNDGHYEPGNVRWATPEQQAANRRPRRKLKT